MDDKSKDGTDRTNEASDVITGDFPPYVPDTMNYAGDVTVKGESFRENRTAIYRRNQLIAVKQRFELKQVKDDITVTVRPRERKSTPAEKSRTSYRIKPAKTATAPTAKSLVKAQRGKLSQKQYYIALIACVAVVVFGIFLFDMLKETQIQRENSKIELYSGTVSGDPKPLSAPEIDRGAPVYGIILKSGHIVTIWEQKNEYDDCTYEYVFEYTNTSNKTVKYFPYTFSYATGADRISRMRVFYPSGAIKDFFWSGGAPTETGKAIIYENGAYIFVDLSDEYFEIASGETITGCIAYTDI